MQRVGRYEVIREIGRGGMGVVLEATDPLIGRTVAIKVIHSADVADPETAPREPAALLEHVLHEARAVGSLSHVGIVVVHDVGHQDDFAFIAMERVDGPTLREMLARQRGVPADQALRILRQAADALDFAHGQGVVHRDVKPNNIMFHRGSTVKLTDFGLAKLLSARTETRTGIVKGTISYMAPEQLQSMPVDGRSDQFALAVTAFEMLTGRRPFDGESPGATVHNILSRDPPLANRSSSTPTAVDAALRRALAKTPADRYATCSEFVNALDVALARVADGSHPMPVVHDDDETVAASVPASRSSRRGRGVWAFGVAALLVTSAGLLLTRQWLGRPAQPVPRTVNSDETKPPIPAAAPIAVQFNAMPNIVEPGQAVTLTWDVSGASEVSIEGFGRVSDSGRRTVFPTKTSIYSLMATQGSQKKSASVEIDVRSKEPSVAPSSIPPPRAAVGASTTQPVQGPAQPTSGRIVWTGRLAAGQELTITGARASSGQLTAALPEAAALSVEVSPTTLKIVRVSGKELVVQNSGTSTETTAIIRWTSKK